MDLNKTQELVAELSADSEEMTNFEDEKGPPVAYLQVLENKHVDTSTFPLYEGENVIGRDKKSSVCVKSQTLSKKHAIIEIKKGSYCIYDVGSLNKTKKSIGTLKPNVHYDLQNEDIIIFADIECRFIVKKLICNADSNSENESEPFALKSLGEMNEKENCNVDIPSNQQPQLNSEDSELASTSNEVEHENLSPTQRQIVEDSLDASSLSPQPIENIDDDEIINETPLRKLRDESADDTLENLDTSLNLSITDDNDVENKIIDDVDKLNEESIEQIEEEEINRNELEEEKDEGVEKEETICSDDESSQDIGSKEKPICSTEGDQVKKNEEENEPDNEIIENGNATENENENKENDDDDNENENLQLDMDTVESKVENVDLDVINEEEKKETQVEAAQDETSNCTDDEKKVQADDDDEEEKKVEIDDDDDDDEKKVEIDDEKKMDQQVVQNETEQLDDTDTFKATVLEMLRHPLAVEEEKEIEIEKSPEIITTQVIEEKDIKEEKEIQDVKDDQVDQSEELQQSNNNNNENEENDEKDEKLENLKPVVILEDIAIEKLYDLSCGTVTLQLPNEKKSSPVKKSSKSSIEAKSPIKKKVETPKNKNINGPDMSRRRSVRSNDSSNTPARKPPGIRSFVYTKKSVTKPSPAKTKRSEKATKVQVESEEDEEEEEQEIVTKPSPAKTKGSRKTRKTQVESEPEEDEPSPAKTNRPRKTKKVQVESESGESEEEEEQEIVAKPSSAKTKRSRKTSKVKVEEDEEEEQEVVTKPSSAKTKGSRKTRITQVESEPEEEEEEEQQVVTKPSSAKTPRSRKTRQVQVEPEPEESGQEIVTKPSSAKTTRSRKTRKVQVESESEEEEQEIGESEEEEEKKEQEIVTRTKRSQKTKSKFEKEKEIVTKPKISRKTRKVESEQSQEEEAQEIETKPKRWQKTRKVESEESESEEKEILTNSRKRRSTTQSDSSVSKRRKSDRVKKEGVVQTKQRETRQSSKQNVSNVEQVGKRKINQKDSSWNDFEISTSKKKKNDKEMDEMKPKIMFTGMRDEKIVNVIKTLGGSVADSMQVCTHLISEKVRRSVKLLSALAKGLPIVTIEWINASKNKGQFLDPFKYLVQDGHVEKLYKFSLKASIKKAAANPLFKNLSIHVTESVTPAPEEMKLIIEAAGGKYLAKLPTTNNKKSAAIIISCLEDLPMCEKAIKNKVPVVNNELVLTGVLQQQFNLDDYLLSSS